ncbi:MAG: SulP family inorganic anion transporter [Gammaproteobacteria bacterium]
MATLQFWLFVFSICLISRAESLPRAVAIDKPDPFQRQSNLNKDLSGLRIGTSLSGFPGGLPIIPEIERSLANIACGARSGWSNFFMDYSY